jgi:hypothetical protein
MNRRIDDDQLVRLLRRAGTEVELDRARIMAVVNSASSGPQTRSIHRQLPPLKRRSPMQLLALPMAAVLGVGLALVVKGGVPAESERIGIVVGQTPQGHPVLPPAPTSRLGDSRSITAPPRTTDGSTGSTTGTGGQGSPGTSPSAPSGSVVNAGIFNVEVAPVPQGSTYRLPLNGGRQWLVVGSSPDGSQPHFPPDASTLGPAQVMGSGQSIEAGPYKLSWDPGATGTQVQQSGTWMVVAGSVRGVESGLRIPVRVQHQPPVKIVLLTGLVGSGGQVTVSGADTKATAQLPSCGEPICPAVVTITLGTDSQPSNVQEMVIDLNATGKDAKVGLAAVELG